MGVKLEKKLLKIKTNTKLLVKKMIPVEENVFQRISWNRTETENTTGTSVNSSEENKESSSLSSKYRKSLKKVASILRMKPSQKELENNRRNVSNSARAVWNEDQASSIQETGSGTTSDLVQQLDTSSTPEVG